MIVLGIESSCDETAVAIVGSDRRIYSHNIHSQVIKHNSYGGVVPEIAARQHMIHMQTVIEKTIAESGIHLTEIDAISVTAGPGLIGGLIVGVMMAKGMALAINKPCVAVNHLEGHALTPRLVYGNLDFPYLLLLISGGHCQILIAEGVGRYHLLGKTRDDSPGEAFDKVAKMLNLGYPGGPIIEKLAMNGNPKAINFPKPLYRQKNCDFSFSGLKTAVRLYAQKIGGITPGNSEIMKNGDNDGDGNIRNSSAFDQTIEKHLANICASFQETVAETLADRLRQAIPIARKEFNISKLVVSGGVASNAYIRKKLEITSSEYGLCTMFPPVELCTDNGAMIAWVGIEKLKLSKVTDINFSPKSSWPLFNM